MEGILIALMVLGIVALVVVAITLKAKKQDVTRQQEMAETFRRIISDEHLHIHHISVLRHKILGIDELKMVLVFVQNHGDIRYDIIEFGNVHDCIVKKATRRRMGIPKMGNQLFEGHICGIDLSLQSDGKTVIDIPIYSEPRDGIKEKSNLTAVAEEWQGLIRNALIKV